MQHSDAFVIRSIARGGFKLQASETVGDTSWRTELDFYTFRLSRTYLGDDQVYVAGL